MRARHLTENVALKCTTDDWFREIFVFVWPETLMLPIRLEANQDDDNSAGFGSKLVIGYSMKCPIRVRVKNDGRCAFKARQRKCFRKIPLKERGLCCLTCVKIMRKR